MFDPPIAPPYASMVIVELFFRELDEQHFVKFSYRNESDRDPYVLNLLGGECGDYCPLAKVDQLTQHLRPADWKSECRLDGSSDDPTIVIITEFSIAVAALLFLVLLVAVIVSCCIRRDKNATVGNKYQSVNQDFR